MSPFAPTSLWLAVVVVATAAPTVINAQTTSTGEDVSNGRPVVHASKVDEGPTIDGEVLGDPVWASAELATDFRQTTPNEGQPVSERTEVRLVYTDDTLYFGVVCYDRDPSSIIVADSRRDASLVETDSFQIILDTYLDEQNGFVFGTNPSGLEYDGQLVNEGEGTGFLAASRGGGGGGRQSLTTGGAFNLNWDGAWIVQTKISEIGWSAEFAIPFRTLRYPLETSQAWGLNFQRNIRRRNETAFWAPLPRGFRLYRLSLAGRVTGLEVPPQRNLKLTPYVLGEAQPRPGALPSALLGEAGIDLKYSITPSLTLDATYNTDFAQVEVDAVQINLNRFNLFFPEKRPFFLENAGLFAVGNAGRTEVFFSRRIGIGPGGLEIPILAGVRLSGNVRGTGIGFLNMQTEDVRLTPANNFTVARVRRELPNRSSVGALFVNRQATGQLAGDSNYNRSYAVDGRLGTGENGRFVGFAARTQTPGLPNDDHAFDMGWVYDSPKLLLNFQYTEVGDNFNPEVGFVRRVGFRQANFLWFRIIRLGPSRKLHEIRPHFRFNSFWDFTGFQETGLAHIDSHWEWKNGAQIDTGMNLKREGLTESFEIFPGVIVPAGTYDDIEAQIVATTNQGAPLSFRVRTVIGGFFGGERIALTPTLRWRIGEAFNTELSMELNDVDLPGGSFVANLVRARVAYSFTPRVLVQSLIQYNNSNDLWSTNLRFSWLQQANTGLFVVYNDTRGLADVDLAGPGRSLIVKFSYLFDVLK